MSERSTVISKLLKNRASREAYIGAKLKVLIPSQIRALRLKSQSPRQEDLANAAEMKQSRVSAMETPGAVNFNLETLVRLAAALKVGLVVKFVSFSEMLKWENGYSQDAFSVPTIDADVGFQRGEAYQQADGTLTSKIEVPEYTEQVSRTAVPAHYLPLGPPKIVPLVVANEPIRNIPGRSTRGYGTAVAMPIQ
jgi:hypothetical protein